MNITPKLISVVKQTPYQFTLQIEVTCGGIEPQFLKQELPTITQIALKKTKTNPTPNTQNLKAQENIKSLSNNI